MRPLNFRSKDWNSIGYAWRGAVIFDLTDQDGIITISVETAGATSPALTIEFICETLTEFYSRARDKEWLSSSRRAT
jgi:hypothetical protein